ncbi:MAG TPA: potassium-transporting ATPase subunit KdpA [Thermomicrobiaceae bacterium]|nr:potassium-transporting ATPase subunit KdpA [Thermomicrobiaceae bacterium]
MTVTGWLQVAALFLIVLALTRPLGAYMARVFTGERTLLAPVLGPVERAIYRVSGVDPTQEQGWVGYTVAVLVFTLFGILTTYLIQRVQGVLPFNPQGLPGVKPDLAFNTAVSFNTNTNWQSYVPETTVTYFTQMAALAVHNFLSAAAGIAIAIALIRAFARRRVSALGNFWVDLTRGSLYVLLPICIVFALVLVWQGVPQNLNAYTHVTTLQGTSQTIAQGPVASQEIIKELGTNGGGFFNANSAHPYENPTPLTNLIEMAAILVIGAGLTYTFGKMVGNTRQGWALFAVMSVIFLAAVAICYSAEKGSVPALAGLHIDQAIGNMNGKETRFGVAGSALWAVVTTVTSCGAVNAMHDSFTAIGGMIPMVDMQLGEVVFGGVGSGLYGMIVFAILAVFLAGLMVGRTPEYLGKKVEAFDMKMVALAILVFPASILGFTALAAVSHWGLAGLNNAGPHGFSEILYAFTSVTANNGSAFAGLSVNTIPYNTTLGLAMLIGRLLVIVPTMALAGSMVRKQAVAPGLGTFPTTGPIWVVLLIGVILIVGVLTFFPALALGPIVEHFLGTAGKLF